MKLLIPFLIISNSLFSQIIESGKDTYVVSPPNNKPGTFAKNERLFFMELSLGAQWNKDSVFISNNGKSSLPKIQFNVQLGKQSNRIKTRFGLDFGSSKIPTKVTPLGNYESFRFISFQSEVGLRGFLTNCQTEKFNVYIDLSWIHGIHTFRNIGYKNVYNGMLFGLGIQRELVPKKLFLTGRVFYQNNVMNVLSKLNNGQLNLDKAGVSFGLLF